MRRKTHIECIVGDGGLEDGDWEIRFLWKLKTSKPRGENVKKKKKRKINHFFFFFYLDGLGSLACPHSELILKL
jgi:hypothetical protein